MRILGWIILVGLLIAIGCVLSACTTHNSMAPTQAPTAALVVYLDYAIHLPNAITAADLNRANPGGLLICPVRAQQVFDYSQLYGGPNVYGGTGAVSNDSYQHLSIVIAPIDLASRDRFACGDWPIMASSCQAGAIVVWRARFDYAGVGKRG